MNEAFHLNRINEVEFYTAPNINNIGFVRHFFSTRIGGISTGHYESLNLGIYTNDLNENVQFNMNRIFAAAKMNRDKMIFLKQVHSDKFFIASKDNYTDINGQYGDALITSEKGIAIGVFTADCVPIILADAKNKNVAVVHAGWKGTALNIAGKVLDYMNVKMGTDTKDVVAAIGPSIGPCCYEVGAEVAQKFNYVYENKNRFYVDLWRENINQIVDKGVLKEKISASNICTSCNYDKLFSYRRESGNTGRLAAFIEIV